VSAWYPGATAEGPADPFAEASGPPLELEDVSFNIGGRWALERLSLSIRPGEVTALAGPSGSGKTTLLSIAGGIVKPTTGFASYDGHHLWQGDGDPRHEIAFVLQVYGLVPILSARENVAIALRARGEKPGAADERADAELARFHIGDLGDRQVEELSGGQMQRVACARAFAVRPRILLADEPTSELDEHNRDVVVAEIRAEARRGAVVVLATHDPEVAEMCDEELHLVDGRVAAVPVRVGEAGPGHEHDLFRRPERGLG
jgi:putative ABC transport system ATP-binding protein